MQNFLKQTLRQVTESLENLIESEMNVWICHQATPIFNKKGVKARCL